MKSNAKEYQKLIDKINTIIGVHLQENQDGSGRVSRQIPAPDLALKMDLKKWVSEGGLDVENVQDFLDPYLEHSQRMHHPHYIGHQVAVPHLASGAADFVQGSINNPMAIYEMGPSASVIEKTMINWMLDKAGWLPGADITEFGECEGNGAGVFTHGGSMANLTALLAARAAIAPEAWQEGTPSDLVIIGSDVSHYSIARSVSIMGLGSNNIIRLPVDSEERMDHNKLLEVIKDLRKNGKRIMAVIANACATSTGLYDPLHEIGTICKQEDLWFHVDGAHGASALISEPDKHLMKGIELADSLIWDTHKMLRTSTLAAAVLFRKPQAMLDTFQQKGSYLFHDKENLGFDLMPYTIECTKAAIATKLFWVLAAEGEAGLSQFVEKQYTVTREFHELISKQLDFECPYYPEANILCFRYKKGPSSNEFQLNIRNEIVRKGEFYITSTEMNKIRYLRLTVINPLTTIDHIKLLLQKIREVATWLHH